MEKISPVFTETVAKGIVAPALVNSVVGTEALKFVTPMSGMQFYVDIEGKIS